MKSIYLILLLPFFIIGCFGNCCDITSSYHYEVINFTATLQTACSLDSIHLRVPCEFPFSKDSITISDRTDNQQGITFVVHGQNPNDSLITKISNDTCYLGSTRCLNYYYSKQSCSIDNFLTIRKIEVYKPNKLKVIYN